MDNVVDVDLWLEKWHLIFNRVLLLIFLTIFWKYRVVQKCPNLFLSELQQISTKFDNFWLTNGQDDRIMW